MIQDPLEAISGRKVFVTGASGFIGRRLVDALASAGARVTVFSRSHVGKKAALPTGVVRVVGGLNDMTLLNSSLRNQEIAINLAYDVRASAESNLKGFDTLLKAAPNAAVGRIVHASSVVVYDGWPDNDIDETGSMTRPGGGGYRRAKIEMEQKLLVGPLPAAILQPSIVYGPGSSQWTDNFAEILVAGGIVLPEPEGRCNGVFVDDVVQALLRAAVLPDLGQERFIVSGSDPFPWSELLAGYAGIIGKGAVRHASVEDLRTRLGLRPEDTSSDAPSALARVSALGRTMLGREKFEALTRLTRRRWTKNRVTYPDHHLLDLFSATGICRIDHARKRLGYAPQFDLADGLTATADHLIRRYGAN